MKIDTLLKHNIHTDHVKTIFFLMMSTQDFFTYSLRSNLSKNTNLGSDWKKTKKFLWSTQTLKKN